MEFKNTKLSIIVASYFCSTKPSIVPHLFVYCSPYKPEEAHPDATTSMVVLGGGGWGGGTYIKHKLHLWNPL